MKILIITVAGSSTRFSKSIGKECLKCIYFNNSYKDALLYKTVYRDNSFDKFIIVGGYKFKELQEYTETYLSELKDKIVLIENKHFQDYGSGYSLYLGIEYAVKCGFNQLVFTEGDILVDAESFAKISQSENDVITFNRECIDAQKSVVFYFDSDYSVHYLYDTSHNRLQINEPFVSVYNSGQIWKFVNYSAVKEILNEMSLSSWYGTNLVFIQKYFGGRNKDGYGLVELKEWYNCNTVDDYNKMTESN